MLVLLSAITLVYFFSFWHCQQSSVQGALLCHMQQSYLIIPVRRFLEKILILHHQELEHIMQCFVLVVSWVGFDAAA